MIFSYQWKLEKYQKWMQYLNDNIDVTLQVKSLLNYARSNEIVKYNFVFLGEIEALYDFYYKDMINYLNLAKESTDNKVKEKYLRRAESDKLLIDEIGENGHVKPIFSSVYKVLRKVEDTEHYIKEEDRIPLNTRGISR